MFLPLPVRAAIAVFRSVKYIKAGLASLLHGKLSVTVLDATASRAIARPTNKISASATPQIQFYWSRMV